MWEAILAEQRVCRSYIIKALVLVFWEFGYIGVLGNELKYYNICNSFSLVKYFFSIFTCGHRLKAETHNFWCPLCDCSLFFFQFHFSCVSASPINFLTVVSKLLVVFFGVEALFTYTELFTYMTLFIDTVLFTRSGSNSRILRCKARYSGVSKATVWFYTYLGKFCHKGDKSLRSLSFKWDRCDPSSLSWELS